MQRLLAGLEIWGLYYHCLSYWRDLHGGKEYPLAPYTPDTSIHSPHTSSSHTFLTQSRCWPVHIAHSSSVSIRLWLISHFTSQTKGLNCLCFGAEQWKCLDKHKRGVNMFVCCDTRNFHYCKQGSHYQAYSPCGGHNKNVLLCRQQWKPLHHLWQQKVQKDTVFFIQSECSWYIPQHVCCFSSVEALTLKLSRADSCGTVLLWVYTA